MYPFLPSISKTAAYEPEGSIFGLMMTLVAFVWFDVCLLSRYLQLDAAVQGDLKEDVLRKVTKLNMVALPFGISCLFGVIVVANIKSNLREVRLVQCSGDIFCRHIPVRVSISLGFNFGIHKAPLSRTKSYLTWIWSYFFSYLLQKLPR